MRSRSAERRRCRPLLGTFVEIAAAGADETRLDEAITAAFSEVECVHRRMSFHAADSDVTRLNRGAWRRPIEVDPQTIEVLSLARELFERSRGAFEIATAAVLVRLGALPRRKMAADARGTTADIELLDGCRVKYRRRLIIDLGGIAKGYAVDRAIETLRTLGVRSGRVNAGGDLRVFGGRQEVYVRHPAQPAAAVPLLQLSDAAVATTAGYFSPGAQAPIVDPRSRALEPLQASVTVRAARCALADALTKVVWLLGAGAAPILAAYDARAWILQHEDRPCRVTACA